MFSTQTISLPWDALPAEMKLSVVELLDLKDVRAFSLVCKDTYALSIPAMWRSVDLKSYQSLQSYIRNVPHSYNRYIRQLSICTKLAQDNVSTSPSEQARQVTDALVELLPQCHQVEQMTLNLERSLSHSIIPCFERFSALKILAINHCGDEQTSPLSERLVVSIAATIPALSQLSLDRITRSAIHAPELVGMYPFVPVVCGDEDIPTHPILGSELSLPSLLRLPTLKKLRIRDTHLGDARWSITPVHCSLEVLDLGSCYHVSPDFNRECTERIIGNVGHTVDEFSLNTAITPESFEFGKPQQTPFKRLRKIHLTPLFPVENVVDTLTTLSGSPVEQLSVKCHEDDVVDMCTALEDFLSLRVERGEGAFYGRLSEITVSTVSDLDEGLDLAASTPDNGQGLNIPAEHAVAVKHLQQFCRDLRIGGVEESESCAPPCEPCVTESSPASRLPSRPTPGTQSH